MLRKPPYDQSSDPSALYTNGNAVSGIDGSIPDAAFFNDLYDELLEVIDFAGLTPSDADHTQLRKAIQAMIPTPSGAPSDASLVHVADDTGTANALVLAPSPAMTSLAKGAIILTWPSATAVAGAATATVTINGAPVTDDLVRDDGAELATGDLIAARLALLQFDGVKWRLLGCRRAVSVDGTSIMGTGLPDSPLRAAPKSSGRGTDVGQEIRQHIYIAGFALAPYAAGFVMGKLYDAADILAGTWNGVDKTKCTGWFGVNSANGGFYAGQYNDPHSNDVYQATPAALTGQWRLVGWDSGPASVVASSWDLVLRRES